MIRGSKFLVQRDRDTYFEKKRGKCFHSSSSFDFNRWITYAILVEPLIFCNQSYLLLLQSLTTSLTIPLRLCAWVTFLCYFSILFLLLTYEFKSISHFDCIFDISYPNTFSFFSFFFFLFVWITFSSFIQFSLLKMFTDEWNWNAIILRQDIRINRKKWASNRKCMNFVENCFDESWNNRKVFDVTEAY